MMILSSFKFPLFKKKIDETSSSANDRPSNTESIKAPGSWNDLYRLLPVSQDHHPSAPPVYAPGVVRCAGTMQDVGPTDGAEITADRPASQPAKWRGEIPVTRPQSTS